MVDALFDETQLHPPAGLVSDNLTALVLRPLRHAGGLDQTALPGK
jgi:hypothetical protein